MSYVTRRIDPLASAEPLASLWRDNLHMALPPEEKLRWYYGASPGQRATAFVLETTPSGASTPVLVGCVGLGAHRFFSRSGELCAALMVDLAVDREHRTLFPSLHLQRAARAHAQAHHDFTYGFPNSRAVRMLLRLGYQRLGTMVRYARPLRFAPFLERRLPSAQLSGAVGFAAEVVDRAWLGARVLARGRGFRLSWGDEPDARYEACWQAARAWYEVIGDRGPRALRWRFHEAPGSKSELVSLRPADGDAVVAWAAVEHDEGLAHLRDLFGGSPDAVGALLDRLLPALRARGAHSVSMRFLGASWLPALLQSRGFQVRDDQRTVVIDRCERSRLSAALLESPESWYLTDFDEPG